MLIELENIDWALLREQKEWLVGNSSDDMYVTEMVDGLLGLIDYIQDSAEEELGSQIVFGDLI